MFALAASSQVFGQKFKPGDKVECDPTGMNDFMKGTVAEYLPKDEPKFQGEYYLIRVVIEKWSSTYPEGVLCQTKQVRGMHNAAPAAIGKTNGANEKNENQPNETAATEFGAKFKPGDRVECDTMNIGKWFKGTVLSFEAKDEPEKAKDKTGKYFYIHRVRMDNEASLRPEGGMCFTDRTRLLTGDAAAAPPVDNSVGKVTTDENNTLSADRPIIECPVAQTKVKNGSRPNAELLKKIIRCDKGEKPAGKGLDGAITVDVTALEIGASRRWNPLEDSGDGKINSTVFPVKATYTVRTFYRTRTVVNENWIRIINFYVDSFGEWRSGSELPVKMPQTKDVPRFPN